MFFLTGMEGAVGSPAFPSAYWDNDQLTRDWYTTTEINTFPCATYMVSSDYH